MLDIEGNILEERVAKPACLAGSAVYNLLFYQGGTIPLAACPPASIHIPGMSEGRSMGKNLT